MAWRVGLHLKKDLQVVEGEVEDTCGLLGDGVPGREHPNGKRSEVGMHLGRFRRERGEASVTGEGLGDGCEELPPEAECVFAGSGGEDNPEKGGADHPGPCGYGEAGFF